MDLKCTQDWPKNRKESWANWWMVGATWNSAEAELKRWCQGTFETLFLSWTASWALAPVMCEKPSDLYCKATLKWAMLWTAVSSFLSKLKIQHLESNSIQKFIELTNFSNRYCFSNFSHFIWNYNAWGNIWWH